MFGYFFIQWHSDEFCTFPAPFPHSWKRAMRRILPDPLYDAINGNTDSEHAFALLLDEIGDLDRELTSDEFADALERTINRITAMSRENRIVDASSMNFAVTDGRHVLATRCRNKVSETPPSLFYCLGTDCSGCGGRLGSVIISSEPLTKQEGKWALVPSNHMLVIPFDARKPDQVTNVLMRPLEIDEIDFRAPHESRQSRVITERGEGSDKEERSPFVA